MMHVCCKRLDYLGSEHGKGEGDGEVGCVNKATEKARLSRWVIINSPSDWYQFCLKELASDKANSKRTFVLVGTDDIVRHRSRPMCALSMAAGRCTKLSEWMVTTSRCEHSLAFVKDVWRGRRV